MKICIILIRISLSGYYVRKVIYLIRFGFVCTYLCECVCVSVSVCGWNKILLLKHALFGFVIVFVLVGTFHCIKLLIVPVIFSWFSSFWVRFLVAKAIPLIYIFAHLDDNEKNHLLSFHCLNPFALVHILNIS